ncbi:MAG: PIN domain-containing protein [Acidobacteria bacterium]|nr:PIN domain-containing protein [Acidobacteriota bacterium]MBV9146295.1 PIN domain-containing protein [Acidobacteriota bacterium]
MRLLADTNVLIDALRKRQGRGEFLEALPLHGLTLCTCAIVLTELYTGLMPADRPKADGMTQDFVFLSTNAELGRLAGALRRRYRDQGVALSTPDCLIAATAIHYEAMLLTDNQKDFPMPELRFYPLPGIA